MNTYLEIEMNEIEHVKELSHYNYVVYKFIRYNFLGFTHLVAKYDDESETPEYRFCIALDGYALECVMSGYGDDIQEDKLGFGGVFLKICIERPDLSLKLKE